MPEIYTALVQRVRSFNRAVTERIGALDDRFLGRDRPLGEARLLWEIAGDEPEVRQLRARLGLDSAYLSRLLRSLEKQGLVRVRQSPRDGRVRRVRLSRAGRTERKILDKLSDDLARSLLEPLGKSQRARLAAAMAEVERLLAASLVTTTVADPMSEAARWCFEQYFDELGGRFDAGFDPARSLSADAHELVPPTGLLLVAWLRDEPVGCGALKLHGRAPAELKRMWLARSVRGLGLGGRLLRELEHHAREAGARTIHLETNRALGEAIALYRKSGYREVPAFNREPYAHHWFEKRLRPRPRGSRKDP
jgi:DNA-binding MarR family transcriptional regulator/GNAT superfamily N-acetyltransferase